MPARSRSFPPIAAPNARVLVLGSLPGQVSLERQQYYAQPQNAFWRIMGALFGAGLELPYEERTKALAAQGIALWDVCKAAVRPGSLDTSIKLDTVVANDFAVFFSRHPGIRAVFFNGAMAARLYTTLVLPSLQPRWQGLPVARLPSTSPAHAALRFDDKLERWSVLRTSLA